MLQVLTIPFTMWVQNPTHLLICILSLYNKLVYENYEGYNTIFTDGFKQRIFVAAAAACHDKVRLPNLASIFSAKAIAILLALDIISQSTKQHFFILSDSLPCVNAIENRNLQKSGASTPAVTS
jgi:hypothetical protein